ncbi:GyrI-like domain-containing protein [Flavobacterium psychraquaticum]|uniref:GyrI-like domain-containing protein n=1 Tax=Flavobacterium psychraquaticum TaxID=3103958 RepID=UPI002ACE0374|nr:GyrI-like domain-containing protein [Flavobacterium sp. LB-N7T]
MRILKYIFLLFLLFSLAFVVFVATQPGDYKIIRSKEIKISKDILFNFVSDTSALQNWSPWNQNEVVFKNDSITSNDTLSQQLFFAENPNKSLFRFENTKKGTLVTWELNGKMDFKSKLANALQGGVHNVIGDKLVDGLINIDNYLVKELSTYTIEIEGLVTKHATNYIQQIDTCAAADFQKVSKRLLQNMISFVAQNEIKITGLPFIVFDNKKLPQNKISFAMCVPVEEEILTTEGSDISGGHFDEFLAIKTILTGDYSHKKEAWAKTVNYVKKEKLIEDVFGKYIEIYKVSLPKERKPSKWVTEIYVPIKRKEAPKFVRPITPTATTEVVIPNEEPQTQE